MPFDAKKMSRPLHNNTRRGDIVKLNAKDGLVYSKLLRLKTGPTKFKPEL